MNRNMIRKNYTIVVIGIIFLLVGALVVTNVFFVMAYGIHIRSNTDITKFSSISVTTETIYARRGYIFDCNGNIIAQDSVSYNMVAILDQDRPSYKGHPAYVPIENKEEYAKILAQALGTTKAVIMSYLERDAYQTEFGNYGRNLSSAKKEEIEKLELYGIEFIEQNSRNYPLGSFAAHLIGYTKFNEEDKIVEGELGLEAALNDYLLGKNGHSKYSQDAYGYALLGTEVEHVAAINGNDVHLTIDKQCQEALEIAISEMVKKFNASKMWGGIMEVETGKMLAWGCYPTFDPNKKDITNYLDLGSQYPYEPGSTMKTFTYAAAIDSGNYNGSDTFNSGTYYIGFDTDGKLKRSSKSTIHGTIVNYQRANLGKVSFDQAYYRSLNTGIATLLEKVISPTILESYLDAFGFFKKVNTDGIYEESGTKNMNVIVDKIATGYGQASSVTTLQLMQAYSAIFNQGQMMKPYFVDYIENTHTNQIVYQGKPEVVGNPIKASTAETIVKMMRKVVTDPYYGTARSYAIPEIKIVAKTGTGEVATGGSYGNEVIISAMIGMPADNPKVMVYIAYQAKSQSGMHLDIAPIKRMLSKVVKLLHLTNTGPLEDEDTVTTEIDPLVQFENTMPSVINHRIDYAVDILKKYKVKLVVLGDGASVINQYPIVGEAVHQGQKVFVLSSSAKIRMPDMVGWSYKDITIFSTLTGIKVKIEGNGYVNEQNIAADTNLNDSMEIVVKLGN